MTSVALIDCGTGNVGSVARALEYAGADVTRITTPEQLMSAARVVLPGVGASKFVTRALQRTGLGSALTERVLKQGIPFLGICVGMQVLAKELNEHGSHAGLGWIDGKVVKLNEIGISDKPVPHMGWNEVEFNGALESFGIQLGRHSSFYFAHSFALSETAEANVVARTTYDRSFVAAVNIGSALAVQFHPEKSQQAGDMLLQWFLDWEP